MALFAGFHVLFVAAATLAAGARLLGLVLVLVLVALLTRFDMLLMRGVITTTVAGVIRVRHVDILMRTGEKMDARRRARGRLARHRMVGRACTRRWVAMKAACILVKGPEQAAGDRRHDGRREGELASTGSPTCLARAHIDKPPRGCERLGRHHGNPWARPGADAQSILRRSARGKSATWRSSAVPSRPLTA